MVRSKALDPDELFETADRLEAEGKVVTALSLLNALGRGSLTTIYKHLENWKSGRSLTVPTLNNEMPDTVKNAFAIVWREAAKEATREAQAVKGKVIEEDSAAIGQFHGALEAIEKLERESEAQNLVIEDLKKQLSKQQAEIARLEVDNVALNATVDELRRQVRSQKI